MPALLFIDTNICLDFYRFRGSGTSLSMLKYFDGNLDRIITTTEVEMEYKKNRQGVILLSLNSIKSDNISNILVPDFLKESQLNASIIKTQKQLVRKIDKLRNRISKLLEDPSRYDPVYQVLQRLFKSREQCHFYRTRDRKFRDNIRSLAQKRFTLGYPPKKERDLSINDAINWEWIIYCAQNCSSDIVIVSRDSDYGIVSTKDAILNDWLRQEFKERVSRKRSIILTNRLADGFKRASIQVTKQEEEEEQRHIESAWLDTTTIASDLVSRIIANANIANIPSDLASRIIANANVTNIASDLASRIVANTNIANIPSDLASRIMANANIANIPSDLASRIMANANIANIPIDTTPEEVTKTTKESSQEEKEKDTT